MLGNNNQGFNDFCSLTEEYLFKRNGQERDMIAFVRFMKLGVDDEDKMTGAHPLYQAKGHTLHADPVSRAQPLIFSDSEGGIWPNIRLIVVMLRLHEAVRPRFYNPSCFSAQSFSTEAQNVAMCSPGRYRVFRL